jgi:glycosyltransferase involved in cell wall biosynthesis
MKKTILFLDQQSWLGGAQRVLDYTLESLGTEFNRIVAFPDKGPFRSSLEEKGIRTLTVPIGTYRSGKKSYLEMAVFAVRSTICGLQLAAAIRRRRIALVYIIGPRCLPAGVFAAWLTGRPSVFHLQLILTRKTEVFLLRHLARHLSRIIACSHAAAQCLLNVDHRLSKKTEVLYNPVPDQFGQGSERTGKQSGTPGSNFTIGMVARITKGKGQHMLLKAAGKLPPEIRGRIRILIVGAPAPASEADFHYVDELRMIAVQYGLQENIVWAGYQTDPGPCYAEMDVLVHPALWDEAMGLVILEALQRGIPVIASRIGGIPEIIDEGFNGLLVAPGDEDALGQALEHFIEDSSLREHLQDGARASLDDQFTLKSFSPKIRKVVCQLCNVVDSNEAKAPDEKSAAWK